MLRSATAQLGSVLTERAAKKVDEAGTVTVPLTHDYSA